MLRKRSSKHYKNQSIDMISHSFRQCLIPDESACYQSHRHHVLLVQNSLNSNELFAYHMHGTREDGRRTYQRFCVSKEHVVGLTLVGYTSKSVQEVESFCQFRLGNGEFVRGLTQCYHWPQDMICLLRGEANSHRKLYTGFIDSHSCTSAYDDFLSQ